MMFTGQAPATAATAGATAINPLLGAGLGVAQGVIGSLFQGISNRRQNKRMVDFWKMNNEYNHPSAQMQRLREAGLNPALLYGNSASGVAGNSSSPPDAAEIPALDIGNPLATYQNSRIQNLQADNLRALNTDIMNRAAKTAADTTKTLAQTKYLEPQEKEKLMRMANETQTSLMRANQARQAWQTSLIEPDQIENYRRKNLENIMDKYGLQAEKLSNEKKLGRLRDAEAELKSLNLDFYQSQAILGMLAKILGLPQFR